MAGVFQLKNVLPWGRNRAEYISFFGLDDIDLDTRILDCASGPASFNAEMTEGLRAAAHRFVLDRPASIEGHVTIRMAAVRDFLDDFEDGKREGRYRTAALPYLPFRDGAYDIALSSHFLFLYSDHFDTERHVANIAEMLRVATEARIFPLLDLDGEPSRHVEPVRNLLVDREFNCKILRVDYEFQKNGNRMMRVYRTGR